MSWKENALRAIFGGDSDRADDDTDAPTAETVANVAATLKPLAASSAPDAATKAKLDRLAELEAKQRDTAIARAASDAAAFAESAVKDGKALPAERAHLAVAFAHAALADAGLGDLAATYVESTHAVSIAAGATSRVESVRQIVAARPAHVLTATTLAGDHSVVPPAKPKDDDEGAFDSAINAHLSRRFPARASK